MTTPYEFEDDGISAEEFFAGKTPDLPRLFDHSYSDETGSYDFGPADYEFPDDEETPEDPSGEGSPDALPREDAPNNPPQ